MFFQGPPGSIGAPGYPGRAGRRVSLLQEYVKTFLRVCLLTEHSIQPLVTLALGIIFVYEIKEKKWKIASHKSSISRIHLSSRKIYHPFTCFVFAFWERFFCNFSNFMVSYNMKLEVQQIWKDVLELIALKRPSILNKIKCMYKCIEHYCPNWGHCK